MVISSYCDGYLGQSWGSSCLYSRGPIFLFSKYFVDWVKSKQRMSTFWENFYPYCIWSSITSPWWDSKGMSLEEAQNLLRYVEAGVHLLRDRVFLLNHEVTQFLTRLSKVSTLVSYDCSLVVNIPFLFKNRVVSVLKHVTHAVPPSLVMSRYGHGWDDVGLGEGGWHEAMLARGWDMRRCWPGGWGWGNIAWGRERVLRGWVKS